MAQSKSMLRLSLLLLGLAILLGLPVVVLYGLAGGLVTGEEFSPDDFSRRKFSYNIIPVINYPYMGVEYVDSTPVLEQLLISDRLIVSSAKGGKKWRLIRDSRTSSEFSDDFQAEILCQYLDLETKPGVNFWVSWNGQHPKLAVRFWPVVAALARNDVYWAIPPIMRRAIDLNHGDDPGFEHFLFKSSSAVLLQEAVACQNQGQHSKAIELFTDSIECLPSVSAFVGRSESYHSLGNDQESRRDLKSADGLK